MSVTESLVLEDVSIGYKVSRRSDSIIASGLSASLLDGEMVCLLGPNGAGKTTLLRTLAGMQRPLCGQVLLNGRNLHHVPVRELAKRLSVILTDRLAGGMMKVYDLVGLGRYPYTNWSGAYSNKDHIAIRQSLNDVGASDLAGRTVAELSDGERQKAMVARALAQDTDLMILDEITAFLDLPRRVEIMRLLRDLTRSTGRSILLSTHDLELALRTADRLWLLGRSGKFTTGAPEDLVLNGAFQAIFESEGVSFEKITGAFRLNEPRHGRVVLTAAGVEATWTAKALERCGFEIISDGGGSLPAVEVVSRNPASWRLIRNGLVEEHGSIYSLIAALTAGD